MPTTSTSTTALSATRPAGFFSPTPAVASATDGNALKEDVPQLRAKRERLRKCLADLEKQIFKLETSYLEGTHHSGNILSGWDTFLSRGSGSIARRRWNNSDRLFSGSSVSGPTSYKPATTKKKKKKKKRRGEDGPVKKKRRVKKDDDEDEYVDV
eukprot:TRINITY_DN591_c0_g2_i1.p1 TRINITY_DN591_c0_g2~~TRINITY_DN591_c0_g2_i1.p1  ORF type:complete len:155 (-),score=48.88 TRINITY_DN591_c0_g2_i1:280-744(-)